MNRAEGPRYSFNKAPSAKPQLGAVFGGLSESSAGTKVPVIYAGPSRFPAKIGAGMAERCSCS